MNLIDLIIIYLACGAPLAVYYFLHNRRTETRSHLLRLKTIFIFFFWLPFAFYLVRQFINFKFAQAKTGQTEIFYSIQKQIEKILLESELKISIYEFREIVERYIGLTLASQYAAAQSLPQEAEIYRAIQAKNIELASICFGRRNRKRLLFHQTEARKDFLRFIEKLSEFGADQTKLADSSFKVVQMLNDLEAYESLENIFAAALQTDRRKSVKRLEKDLWKPVETRKPQPAKSVPIHLSNMIATTNLRKKD